MDLDYAKAFRVIRAVLGWQQAELAKELDISASQLSLIEAGKRQPSMRVLNRLSATAKIPTALIVLLASNEEAISDQNVPALSSALLRLLVAAGSKQRPLPLESK